MLVAEPDESHLDALAVRHIIGKLMTVVAVCLAELALHTIAIDGVLESPFRYTDEQLQWRFVGFRAFL